MWQRSATPLWGASGPVHFGFYDEGPVSRLFRTAKRSGNRRALDALYSRLDLSRLIPSRSCLFLPVPPSMGRLISRGLSVPDSLGFRLSKVSGIPCSLSGIRRTRDDPQKGQNRMERREALFSPRFVIESRESSRWPKEGLVLVDDLFVTGWTLRSVQTLLAREGVPVRAMITLLYREGRGEEGGGDRGLQSGKYS